MKALNEEEADRFWAAADADPMGIVFLFAVISGMRPEEFLGLRWSDLDLNREQPDGTLRSVARVKQVLCWRRKKGGGWYIDETKTSQSRREISLPQVLVDRLLKHKQEQKHAQPQFEHLDLVFRTEAGGPLHSDNLGARDLRRILKAAGLPYTDPKTGVRGLRLYDLRHSCATLLLAEGKHAKVVADRLGHASVAMTLDVYSHVTRRLEDEVAESFDRKFNKPNEKRRSGS
jgi:integrase